MAEERVYSFLKEQNKPFNVQNVADMLAQFGIKKPQVQRALQSLAEAGKIKCKEFGKTMIYIALQDGLEVLSKEEMDAKLSCVNKLSAQVKQEEDAVKLLTKELHNLQSSLTLGEITAKIASLKQQSVEAEQKLQLLSSGSTLISAEDRSKMEKVFSSNMSHWAQRKRIFKDVWDTLSENIDQNRQEFFEDIGVETDESVGCNYAELTQILPKKGRF